MGYFANATEKIDDLHEMLIDLQMYITVSGISDDEAVYLEKRINEIRNKVFELEDIISKKRSR